MAFPPNLYETITRKNSARRRPPTGAMIKHALRFVPVFTVEATVKGR
jgi:hypothetical protein